MDKGKNPVVKTLSFRGQRECGGGGEEEEDAGGGEVSDGSI